MGVSEGPPGPGLSWSYRLGDSEEGGEDSGSRAPLARVRGRPAHSAFCVTIPQPQALEIWGWVPGPEGGPLWGPGPCLCGAGRALSPRLRWGPFMPRCVLGPTGAVPWADPCLPDSPFPSAFCLQALGSPPGRGCFLDLFASYAQASGRPPSPGLPPRCPRAPCLQQEDPCSARPGRNHRPPQRSGPRPQRRRRQE